MITKKKILLFSDLHLRPESEDVCFHILDMLLGEAEKYAVDAIGFLGDFWHLRYQVPVNLLNRVGDWVASVLDQFGPKSLIMLPGNHDQINVHGESALDIFKAVGATVHRVPTIDRWGAWMPYRKDPALGLASLKVEYSEMDPAHRPRPVLFAHLPVQGAMMNNLMDSKEGVEVHSFNGWEHVLLGHFHKRQSWWVESNQHWVQYIGSPWQTRPDEFNQEKGFAILETDGIFSMHSRAWGTRYHRFHFSGLEQYEAEAGSWFQYVNPGDHVRLIAPSFTDEFRKAIIESYPSQHMSFESTEAPENQPRFAFQKDTSLHTYAQAYVKDNANGLDSNKLMSYWTHLAGATNEG